MNTPSSMLRITWLLLVVACGTDSTASTDAQSAGKGGSTENRVASNAPVESDAREAGAKAGAGASEKDSAKDQDKLSWGDDDLAWRTDEFSLEPGQERYLCFTQPLEDDVVVDGYRSSGQAFVHHLIFARTLAPEPEGFSECDIAFRNTWDTLFISGAGDAKLEFPSDAGHTLKKGSQLLVQMHLLNSTDDAVSGAVTIRMHRSTAENPRPVNTYVFGTAGVRLPANETTEITGTCTMREPAQLIAGFPHMHLLGKSLRFEVGSSKDEMREIFKREPYDFDNQRIENLDLHIGQGDVTRVSCTFTNTLPQEVTYGESTHNEMCFFVGFAVDRSRQAGCLEVLPPSVSGQR